jgi:hypothetical protein
VFLSPRFQSANPYNAWVSGYAGTIGFEWRTYPGARAGSVMVDIISTDATPSGRTVQYFSGVWNLVRGAAPGGWLLDSARIGTGSSWGSGGSDFSRFADGWVRHGYGLSLHDDGTATVSFRVYTWCSDDPTPPCDFFSGDSIISGGHETITFTAISGDTIYGTYDDGGAVALTLLPYDMVELDDSDGTSTQLCGSRFAALAPPDVQREGPCGA